MYDLLVWHSTLLLACTKTPLHKHCFWKPWTTVNTKLFNSKSPLLNCYYHNSFLAACYYYKSPLATCYNDKSFLAAATTTSLS